ncbi:MAG: hypothetical protein PHP85_08385 [Gallionella sp.]|nr:hypothetical protein [Gallionella sp.]
MVDLSVIELDTPPDDFLADEPEGAAFYKAFQASGIGDFDCRYLAVFKNGMRIAVVPYFLGNFSLGMLLPHGMLKKCTGWIRFGYACVGHPSTDFGQIEGEVSAEVLNLVNATLAKKSALIAYKGFPEDLPLTGFIRARGLPVAVLTPAADYYSGLDGHRRNDFRHKLNAASTLRLEQYSTLPGHLQAPVYQLYLDTLRHTQLCFEILTPEYFRAVSGLGQFHLYFEGARLIGFLQMIVSGKKANLKYMGMDHRRNRQYFLYFVMCLRGIEAALHAGCTRIELGVSSYPAKRLMGCELVETCVFFRHSHVFFHWLLGKVKFFIEPSSDELR